MLTDPLAFTSHPHSQVQPVPARDARPGRDVPQPRRAKGRQGWRGLAPQRARADGRRRRRLKASLPPYPLPPAAVRAQCIACALATTPPLRPFLTSSLRPSLRLVPSRLIPLARFFRLPACLPRPPFLPALCRPPLPCLSTLMTCLFPRDRPQSASVPVRVECGTRPHCNGSVRQKGPPQADKKAFQPARPLRAASSPASELPFVAQPLSCRPLPLICTWSPAPSYRRGGLPADGLTCSACRQESSSTQRPSAPPTQLARPFHPARPLPPPSRPCPSPPSTPAWPPSRRRPRPLGTARSFSRTSACRAPGSAAATTTLTCRCRRSPARRCTRSRPRAAAALARRSSRRPRTPFASGAGRARRRSAAPAATAGRPRSPSTRSQRANGAGRRHLDAADRQPERGR